MRYLVLISILLLFNACKVDPAVESTDLPGIYDFLSDKHLKELHLEADVNHLIDHKDTEELYPAKIRLIGEHGFDEIANISIAARGKTRKNYCDIPPLKIRFPLEQLANWNLAPFKSIKLVSPCKEQANHQELVFREYLCYKLFQELSEESLDATLVKVKLTDTKSGKQYLPNYSFLIEPMKSCRQRLDAEKFPSTEKAKTLSKNSYAIMTLFQFMIGNTDWNIKEQHNMNLVVLPEATAPIAIPYDFDYCGLVNSDYARPHHTLPVKNVRDRLFQCRLKDKKILNATIDHFINKKQDVLSVVRDFELLEENSKTDMLNYLEGFYKIIESEQPIKKLEASSYAAKTKQ